MSYSYYEVYTNAQRAFSGLGFPYGADEDAAFIISWLEAFELNGIHLFYDIQKKIDSNFNGALENNKLTNRKIVALGGINNNNIKKLKLVNCSRFAYISNIIIDLVIIIVNSN